MSLNVFRGDGPILTEGAKTQVRRKRDPDANRAHQRAWYWRTKKCQASYRCAADDRVLAMLIERDCLAPDETGNAREVNLAITVFLTDHAKAHAAKKETPGTT